MYINGRKITIEELEALANKLIGSLIDDLYNNIKKDGIQKHIPGPKKRQKSVLDKMIQYYISTEEYEKCAYIHNLIETIFINPLKTKNNGKSKKE